MTLTQHLFTTSAIWLVWLFAGVLYDPIVAPDVKNGAPQTQARFLIMWAYCTTLRGWLFLSRLRKRPDEHGKSFGELAAAVFVMASRKYLRVAIRTAAGRR